MTAFERAKAYARAAGPAVSGSGGHAHTFGLTMALVHGFRLSAADSLAVLQDWNAGCLPPWSACQLRHKIQSAAHSSPAKAPGWLLNGNTAPANSNAPLPPAAPKLSAIKFDETKLAALAAKALGVDEKWLAARSPITPHSMNATSFLTKLYQPGERVLIFTNMQSATPSAVWEMTPPPQDCRALQKFETGQADGVWFLCNPVDGQWHERPGDKPSCRCAEAVTSFRFAVLESDCAKPELWLPALVQMPIKISAIYTSGKRSIHALWRIDAESKAAWDAAIRPLKPALKVLGADPGALSGVRLTRLPGCERGECKGKQRLLYLNPDPQEKPILEMEER